MDDLPPLRAWKVLLLALLISIGIGLASLFLFDLADQPVSPEAFRADPGIGQRIADRNNGLVFMHAVAQFAFVLLGTFYLKIRGGSRALFLSVVIPIGALVFLISTAGLIAK